MNDRKMQQMMKQMGIEMTEIDAEEIVITTPDEELVFSDAEVQRMNAQGQQTYTIVGEPESRPRGDGGAADAEGDDAEGADLDAATEADESGEADAGGAAPDIEDADVELVAQRAGVSEDDARAALEETDGDLAAAISRLE